MSTLKGCIKFAYGDNQHTARKNLNKDIHQLVNVYALNKKGVTYCEDCEDFPGKLIINESEDGWSDGRYYGEYYIRIEGSELGPAEMREEIKNDLQIDNIESIFIYD
jgi:hypothetical protein